MEDKVIVTVQTIVEAIQASGESTAGICESDIFTYTKRKYNSEGTKDDPNIKVQTKNSIEMGLEYGIIEKHNHLYRLPKKFDPPTPPKGVKSNSDKKNNHKIETLFKHDDSKSSSLKRKHSRSSNKTKTSSHVDKNSAGKPVKRIREFSKSSTAIREPLHANDVNTRKRESSKSPDPPAKKKNSERSCALDAEDEEDKEMDEDVGNHGSGFITSSSSSSFITSVPEEGEVDELEGDEEDGEDTEEGDEEDREDTEDEDDYAPCNCESCQMSAAYNRSFYKSEEYRSKVEYVVCTDEDLERVRLKNKERLERDERKKAEKRAMKQNRDREESKRKTKGNERRRDSEYVELSRERGVRMKAEKRAMEQNRDREEGKRKTKGNGTNSESKVLKISKQIPKNKNTFKNVIDNNIILNSTFLASNFVNHSKLKQSANRIIKEFCNSRRKQVDSLSSGNPDSQEYVSTGGPAASKDKEIRQYVIGTFKEAGSLLFGKVEDKVAGGDGANNVDAEEEPIVEDENCASLSKNVDMCQEYCCLKKGGETETLQKAR